MGMNGKEKEGSTPKLVLSGHAGRNKCSMAEPGLLESIFNPCSRSDCFVMKQETVVKGGDVQQCVVMHQYFTAPEHPE